MPGEPVFLDTNMWVYLFTDPRSAEDRRKQNIVQEALSNHSNIVVSTQVLNEASNVWLKKYGLDIDQVKSYLKTIQKSAEVHLIERAADLPGPGSLRALQAFLP
uniref:PIN domain-containing protein n=1 Tax=Candidatus Kentrum sp. LFY TaxID=2126342 RepID=A0A450WHD3_9GAMM|nr:MAG: hypothetical protein BECKLFY1418C_GA0070996_102323 [Candidatus Kentron sp. LFY]